MTEHGLLLFASGLTDPYFSLAASLALFSAYGLDRPAALNAPNSSTTPFSGRPLSSDVIKQKSLPAPDSEWRSMKSGSHFGCAPNSYRERCVTTASMTGARPAGKLAMSVSPG